MLTRKLTLPTPHHRELTTKTVTGKHTAAVLVRVSVLPNPFIYHAVVTTESRGSKSSENYICLIITLLLNPYITAKTKTNS